MMFGKAQDNEKMIREKENLVDKVKAFFSQRYVWLSLAVGFLWMFSVPFILTPLLEVLGDSADQFAWIFQTAFFPFTFSLYLLSDVIPQENWFVIYVFSFVLSMLFCLGVAFIIHRVRFRTGRILVSS